MLSIRQDISLKVICDASGNVWTTWKYQGSAPRVRLIGCDIVIANVAAYPSTARVEAVLFNRNDLAVGSLIQEALTGFSGVTWWGNIPINTGDYVKAACYNALYLDLDSLNVKICIVEEWD